MVIACTSGKRFVTVALFDENTKEPVFRYTPRDARPRNVRLPKYKELPRPQREAALQHIVLRSLGFVRLPKTQPLAVLVDCGIQRALDFARFKIPYLDQVMRNGTTVIVPRDFELRTILLNATHRRTTINQSWHLAAAQLLNER